MTEEIATTKQRARRSRREPEAAEVHPPEPTTSEEVPDVPAGRRLGLLDRAHIGTYAGIGLIVAGFALLAFTWSRVAGEILVPLQLPYIASGGFTALGLLILGASAIHLDAKRRDAASRDRQLEELAALLEAMAKDGTE